MPAKAGIQERYIQLQAALALRQAWVEGIAQSITEEVKAKHREKNSQTWEER
jgi:hypothetical protein